MNEDEQRFVSTAFFENLLFDVGKNKLTGCAQRLLFSLSQKFRNLRRNLATLREIWAYIFLVLMHEKSRPSQKVGFSFRSVTAIR